ncbi:hypothetical protein SCLCIDRAFT_45585, partial [Scleroderma citrinum Foug A]
RLLESLTFMQPGTNEEQESRVLQKHPSSLSGMLDHPTIILGEGDTIALWYLPGALAPCIQDHIADSIDPLAHPLEKSITNKSWRTTHQYFKEDLDIYGCLEFSLAQHMLGHTMCTSYLLMVSQDLASPSGNQWTKDICLPSTILSGVLSTIHPSLYNAGHLAMERLTEWATGNDPSMAAALSHWSTVFTNISLIVNQSTPFHRDPHSWSDWYDMLVSVSEYDDCALHIPTLGIKVLYTPGTVMAFSGQLLQHGVNEVDGARCCLAYYMRDNIH